MKWLIAFALIVVAVSAFEFSDSEIEDYDEPAPKPETPKIQEMRPLDNENMNEGAVPISYTKLAANLQKARRDMRKELDQHMKVVNEIKQKHLRALREDRILLSEMLARKMRNYYWHLQELPNPQAHPKYHPYSNHPYYWNYGNYYSPATSGMANYAHYGYPGAPTAPIAPPTTAVPPTTESPEVAM